MIENAIESPNTDIGGEIGFIFVLIWLLAALLTPLPS